MKYLLDSHTLIWFLNGDGKLSLNSKNLIENTDNQIFVSVCSIWEIGIKIGLQKLEFDGEFSEFLSLISSNSFTLLHLDLSHILEYSKLEFIHRDPFDRILIAQAINENMIILSKDENIRKYSVLTDW